MGKKSGGSPPPAPDPVATAQAQTQMNEATARLNAQLNRINQTTPYGTMTYNKVISPADQSRYDAEMAAYDRQMGAYNDAVKGGATQVKTVFDPTQGRYVDTVGAGGALPPLPTAPKMPESDQWESKIELSPEQQRQLDNERALGNAITDLGLKNFGRVGEAQAQAFNFDGIPNAPGVNDFSADRRRVEDAYMQRFNEDIGRQRSDLEGTLAAQGVTLNSEQYNRAMDEVNRRRNDAMAQALMAGGQEQSRLYGLGQNARERAIQERTMLRAQPINELAALLGTAPGIQVPQFTPPGSAGVQPVDYAGLVGQKYAGDLNAYNQRQASGNSLMGGLFGLGGSLGSAALFSKGSPFFLCSRKYKTNGRPVAEILPRIKALPVEAWDYHHDGSTHIGPYAEDFRDLFGVGDGDTIPGVDAFGVCLLGIKELTQRVEALEAAHG